MMQLTGEHTEWRTAASEVAVYLETALPLHYADEEADLFPLLRERCLPEDGLETILSRLHAEHLKGNRAAKTLAHELRKCLSGRVPPHTHPTVPGHIEGFVTLERLHLALENAVLIPIARARLTNRDLGHLSNRMRWRRHHSSALQSGER